MDNRKKTVPFFEDSSIEQESLKLLHSYGLEIGKKIEIPVPVFDIIEYLGYDIDFRNDGIYEDDNILGGLLISEKKVEINENLSSQEGRMNFTAAHEIGHIVLHVPLSTENSAEDSSNIICRKDQGFEGMKKEPREQQADKFAAYLLMPTVMVKNAFFRIRKRPANVKKKSILEMIFSISAKQKGRRLAEKVIQVGHFENVSKMAMMNRLIGLGLIRGLPFQKTLQMKNKKGE